MGILKDSASKVLPEPLEVSERKIFAYVNSIPEMVNGSDLASHILKNLEGVKIKRKWKGKYGLVLEINDKGKANYAWEESNTKWTKSKLSNAILDSLNACKWRPAQINGTRVTYRFLCDLRIVKK
jgi:hypothetical protein